VPTLLRVGDYRFFRFSFDGSEQPHIHVEASGGRYAKIWLQPILVARNRGFEQDCLEEILNHISQNRLLLLESRHEIIRRAPERVSSSPGSYDFLTAGAVG
jgi:hypothetical protein